MCEYRNSAILFTTLILYFISVAITSWNVIFLECYIYKLNLKSFKFQNAKKKNAKGVIHIAKTIISY